MAVDTPAHIAVLGAGPVGLEAALYARFLGYDVTLYERAAIAEHVLRWGHARMFTPWQMNVSPLGLAALRTQHPDWHPPADDALLTGRQWAEAYLLPLAASDLLADSLQLQTDVLGLARRGLLKGDAAGDEERGEHELLVMVRDAQGHERIDKADVVIDATGTYRQPNPLGRGGLPALGERQVSEPIEYFLPDIAGEGRARYAGRSVLVAGAGHSAAANVLALAGLEPPPTIFWVTRRAPEADAAGPVRLIPSDRLPERDRVARAANALAAGGDGALTHWPGTWVKRVEWSAGMYHVQLVGDHKQEIEVERIIASVGYRPDHALAAELQMAWCSTTGAPRNLAASAGGGPERLLNPEPDYYVLGAKSGGRGSQLFVADGLRQIRDLFTIIGDRAGLDLYGSLSKQ
jgi:thioredoxin reductase